jgi:hypothetical protein
MYTKEESLGKNLFPGNIVQAGSLSNIFLMNQPLAQKAGMTRKPMLIWTNTFSILKISVKVKKNPSNDLERFVK